MGGDQYIFALPVRSCAIKIPDRHIFYDYSTSVGKVKGKPALVFHNHFPYNVLQFTHALTEAFCRCASWLAKPAERFREYMADAISEKEWRGRGIEPACVISEK